MSRRHRFSLQPWLPHPLPHPLMTTMPSQCPHSPRQSGAHTWWGTEPCWTARALTGARCTKIVSLTPSAPYPPTKGGSPFATSCPSSHPSLSPQGASACGSPLELTALPIRHVLNLSSSTVGVSPFYRPPPTRGFSIREYWVGAVRKGVRASPRLRPVVAVGAEAVVEAVDVVAAAAATAVPERVPLTSHLPNASSGLPLRFFTTPGATLKTTISCLTRSGQSSVPETHWLPSTSGWRSRAWLRG